MADFTLQDLEKRVHERATASADVSYTRKLLDRGVSHCAKKLGEEAVETVIAADPRGRQASRPARPRTCSIISSWCCTRAASRWPQVEAVLAERQRQSGLEEKASRPRSA